MQLLKCCYSRRGGAVGYPPQGVETASVGVLVIAGLLAAVHAGPTVAAQNEPQDLAEQPSELTAECVKQLQLNAASLSILSVSFEIDREYRVSGLPRAKHDSVFFHMNDSRFFWRRQRTMPSPGGATEDTIREEEMTFDGDVFYLGDTGRSGGTRIVRMLGDNPEDSLAKEVFVDCAYLECAGFSIPSKPAQWRESPEITSTVLDMASSGQIVENLEEDGLLKVTFEIPEPVVEAARAIDLDVFAQQLRLSGVSEEIIEGEVDIIRQRRSLRRSRVVRVWLNPGLSYAMVRREDSTPDGRLIKVTECSDFYQTEQKDLWLPRNGVVQTYVKNTAALTGFIDEPNQTDRITLQDASFTAADGIVYSLDYGSGALVTDRSTEAAKTSPTGAVSHVSPASKDELRDAANEVTAGSRTYLLLVNLGFVILIVGIIVWRKLAASR